MLTKWTEDTTPGESSRHLSGMPRACWVHSSFYGYGDGPLLLPSLFLWDIAGRKGVLSRHGIHVIPPGTVPALYCCTDPPQQRAGQLPSTVPGQRAGTHLTRLWGETLNIQMPVCFQGPPVCFLLLHIQPQQSCHPHSSPPLTHRPMPVLGDGDDRDTLKSSPVVPHLVPPCVSYRGKSTKRNVAASQLAEPNLCSPLGGTGKFVNHCLQL